MNDMTPEELAEMIARYRYQAKMDKDRIDRLEGTIARLYVMITELEKKNNAKTTP